MLGLLQHQQQRASSSSSISTPSSSYSTIASCSSLSSTNNSNRMWSSARDRRKYIEEQGGEEESKEYIQKQIMINKGNAIMTAIELGIVSLEDILSYPIDWSSLAVNYISQKEQYNNNNNKDNVEGGLGLIFDNTNLTNLYNQENQNSFKSTQLEGGLEIQPILTKNIVEEELSSTSSSTPPTSMPPTPTFSLRELSSEISESNTSLPTTPNTVNNSNDLTPIDKREPLAKRRKILNNQNLYLSNLPILKISWSQQQSNIPTNFLYYNNQEVY